MQVRSSIAGVIALGLLAAGCSNQPAPTQPTQTQKTSASGLNAAATVNAVNFTIRVTKVQSGGTGDVTSISPEGIVCGTTCSASFPSGTPIELFASVNTGQFGSWTAGPCAGSTNQSCSFTLTANTLVTASFLSKPLQIVETTLPDGNLGAEYTAFLTSTGGTGPDQHKWRIVDGSLPKGLKMEKFFGVQSTLIHGTPTQIGTSTFTVQVTDGVETATKTFTITINSAVPLEITLPGPTAQSGTVGQFYFQNLFASGGEPPYEWSITGGALPPGLQIVHTANGNRIEGTPTTAGTFTFNLTVQDQAGQQTTQVTTITIN